MIFNKTLIATSIAFMVFAASQSVGAVPADASDAQVMGSTSSLTLQTSLRPESADTGKNIAVFVIAVVPTAKGDMAYAKTANGWQLVSAGATPLPLAQIKAGSQHAVNLTQFDDARGLTGAKIYVGYGVQGSTPDFTFNDMVNNGRYRLVYTFPAEETAAVWSLKPTSAASLKTLLTQAIVGSKNSSYYPIGGATSIANASPLPTPTPATVPSSTDSAASNAMLSGTTLQEAGVDEADLVKTDGTFVWSLLAPSITDSTVIQRHALQATTPALLPVDTVKLPFSKGNRLSGLFLDSAGKQLAVMGESGNNWYGGMFGAWFSSYAWMQGNTEVSLVDTASPTQMKTKRHLKFNASQIGSRRIGSTLYLVLRTYPTITGFDPYWYYKNSQQEVDAAKAANQAAVNAAQLSDMLPQLSVDGGTSQPVVDAASCYTQPGNANATADIITLVAIDLSSSTERHTAKCFTGGTEAFYMSDKSIYLATTRYSYDTSQSYPVYSGRTSTDIHKFALNGMDIAYRGSGSVKGHLGFAQDKKSFRMGEYQGDLRIITQSTSMWGGWGWWALPVASTLGSDVSAPIGTTVVESPGQLSILREKNGNLELVGELPNARRPAPLGKAGEQLYATRFLGNRGFLVTYRLTDPLYVMDLSTPTDPLIAGELQVSGYSDYLFPLSENVLLGVGKDAVSVSDGSSGDGRFAWYQGVKLSLIDISNPAQPREAARSIVGKRGTSATVLYDHHGIAIAGVGTNNVRISLPVSVNESTPYYFNATTSAASDYFSFTRNELAKFDINLAQKTLIERAPLSSFMPTLQRDISSDRSIIWNDQVHYYQSGDWKSSAW